MGLHDGRVFDALFKDMTIPARWTCGACQMRRHADCYARRDNGDGTADRCACACREPQDLYEADEILDEMRRGWEA